MQFVLSCIASRKTRPVFRKALEEAIAVPGLAKSEPIWLAEDEAADVALSYDNGWDALTTRDWVRARLEPLQVDTNLVPVGNRRKRLLVADMDSTMIEQECIDELGSLAGLGDRIRTITARAMRGELDFAAALRERVALMKDLPAAAIRRVLEERLSFMPGGATLIATMKAHGAAAVLVSGGFTQFTSHVAAHLGFRDHRANRLEIENGVLTGRVHEPILGKDAKVAALVEFASTLQLSPADVIAVGDGANDIPMLRKAGLGVALHAKPAVQDAVPVAINHGDLQALLYLQGYRREEFVIPS